MKSKTPATQLPAILANPSTGIVNSKLVKAHGGTAAANAAKADKAEQWLNSTASAGAGSGPYTLKSYSTTSQITLAPNTKYWGAKKPAFGSVVVRNMIAPTQLINVQRGSHEIAIDLSADQAQTLEEQHERERSRCSRRRGSSGCSRTTTRRSRRSRRTSSSRQAVRYALDYKSIVSVAGPGAIQAPGIIPSMFLGSLPQSGRDQAGPHEGEGGARRVGRRGARR